MAAPGRQQVDIPFSIGLDQKSDARYIKAGAAGTIVNAVRMKDNAIQKRFGNTALSNSVGTLAGGATCGGTPIVALAESVGGSRHGIVSDLDGHVLSPQVISILPECIALPRVPIPSQTGGSNVFDWDVATWGQYLFVATVNWGPSGTIYKTVIQYDTGTWQIVSTSCFGEGYAPKLLVIGNTLLLFSSQGGTIYCASWALSANVRIGPTGDAGLITGGSGLIPYDVCAIPGTSYFDLAFLNSTTSIRITTFTSTLSSVSSALQTIAAVPTLNVACSCRGATYPHWVAYSQGTSAPYTVYAWCATDTGSGAVNSSAGAPIPSFTMTPSVGKIDIIWNTFAPTYAIVSASTAVLYNGWPSTSVAQTTFQMVFLSGSPTKAGSDLTIPNLQMGSRITYLPNGELGGLLHLPSKYQPSTFLMSFDGFLQSSTVNASTDILRPIAVSCARTAGAAWGTPFQYGYSNYVNQHIVSLPASAKNVKGTAIALCEPTAVSAFNSQLNLQSYDVGSPLQYQSCEVNAGIVCAAGVVQSFDGIVDMEAWPIAYPEIISTAISTGGAVDVGQHQYVAIFEVIDNAGNRRQTAYGAPASVTTTSGTQTVTVTISAAILESFAGLYPTYNNTTQPMVACAIYRTLVNGTTYYRVSADPSTLVASWAQSTGPVASLSFVDSSSDASISTSTTSQILFDTGGVLDPVCPPSSSICVKHQGRVFLSGGPDSALIWPSTQIVSNVMPTWNEALNITATGAVTALASMDSNLIIFVRRAAQYGIEYVSGWGPNNLGANSDWTPPTAIQSDTGAVDWRCVCAIPAGLLFRGTTGGPNGSGGIFILSRAFQVQYVSGPVENLLSQYPIVTSMITHPNNGRVYITLATSDTLTSSSTGVRIVYDYLHDGTWTVDYLADTSAANGQCAVRTAFVAYSSALGGSAYYWVSGAGNLYRETNGIGTNSYTDAGTYVTLQYASSWLKPSQSGSVRYHTVQLEADALDAHNLTMSLNFDGAPSSYYSESPAPWSWSQIQSFDRYPQEDVQITPSNQKAKSIQVVISDSAPTSGLYPSNYPLTIGVIPAAWYKADSGVITGPSGAVDTWVDSSGNSNNALTVGAPKPILTTSALLGGLPCVSFSGASYMPMDSVAWCAGVNTMFVVCILTSPTNAGIVGDPEYTVGIITDAGAYISSYWGNRVGSTITMGQPIIAGFVGNTHAASAYVNSVTATATGDTGVYTTAGAMVIGNGFGGLIGVVSEVICYASALTPAQIAGIQSYLSQKYSVAIAGYSPISWATGQGPSLAALSIDIEVGDGLFPNLPQGQRA